MLLGDHSLTVVLYTAQGMNSLKNEKTARVRRDEGFMVSVNKHSWRRQQSVCLFDSQARIACTKRDTLSLTLHGIGLQCHMASKSLYL